MDVGPRYVLGRLIGEGATASVHEAEDTVLRRRVAVKVFRDREVGDSAAERIDEEARILASLAHPHLLQVYDSGRGADGHRFLVMPLIRGTTLTKVVDRGPVAPREVKRIGTALSEALAHIHARGIVHRDVKPSNVLLDADGTPYLADFGLAHAEDSPALTATDCIVGTAGYLAPEQAAGLPLTPAIDVYALGLVLLEALTGERAYHGTPLERATANALRPPGIPARLGPGWQRVLRAMTARAPSARPGADAVGALLAGAEDELPEVAATDDTVTLPAVDSWPSPVSAAAVDPVLAAAAVPVVSSVPRPRNGRRAAVVGVMGLVAALAAGLGADWLAAGATADTRAPGVTAPGAGGQPAPASSSAADPGKAAAPVSTVPASTGRSVQVPAQTSSPSPSAKCQGGGEKDEKDDGHGTNKCHGGDGKDH